MKRKLHLSLAALISLAAPMLVSCGQSEITSISSLGSNLDAHKNAEVQIEGVHVSRSENRLISTSGILNFITLADDSGRIDVWFNTVKRRCPPRMGARVIAEGKVSELVLVDTELADTVTRQVFVAGSFSIEEEPELANGEVRLCQLSLQDQQMIAMEGVEALQEYWSASGKRERTVIFE